jgi:peptide/nickel transport system permease protein
MSVLAARRGSVREGSPVLRFIVRRSFGALAGIVAASVVIFVGCQLLPGNAASVVLGRSGDPAAVAALNRSLQLDKPAVQQYSDWLRGFVRGDLGDSAVGLAQGARHAPIWPLISNPVKNSVILAVITALLMIPLSLGLGVLAAVYAGRFIDNVVSLGSLAAISLPEFVIGSLLVGVFFVGFDLLPPVAIVAPDASPLDSPTKLILPIGTLLLASLAAGIRMVRAGMLEVLQTEYVQAARLNGLSERRVLWRYGLRNALAPSVQIFALSIQYLFGGVIVTESVFAYPGLGKQLVSAVQSHDDTQVQAIAIILATVYILINILADLLVVVLVPKLRTQA